MWGLCPWFAIRIIVDVHSQLHMILKSTVEPFLVQRFSRRPVQIARGATSAPYGQYRRIIALEDYTVEKGSSVCST